jgi:hypothetical protein
MGWLDESSAVVPSAQAAAQLKYRPRNTMVMRGDPIVDWTTVLFDLIAGVIDPDPESRPSPRNIIRGPERRRRATPADAETLEVSVGFLHPSTEVDSFGIAISGSDQAFRVLAVGPWGVLRRNGPVPLSDLRYILGRRSAQMDPVDEAAYSWRSELGTEPYVVVRDAPSFEPHCDPVGFGGGSRGALVRNYQATVVGELGCAHVISGGRVGDVVQLGLGATAAIIGLDNDVDLAVVKRECDHELTPRLLQRWPAQWMPCSFSGNATSITARIAQVTNTYGLFADPLMPVWIDLDEAGAPGDSGAAVVDQTSGNLCGIYRGSITHTGGIKFGRCVHIQQAEQVMGLEFVQ